MTRTSSCLRRLLSTIRSAGRSSIPPESLKLRSEQYWTNYNVTGHRTFTSRAESLRYFSWRSDQYFDYLRFMPVAGHDGLVVLDYGCGPGHDLVGFMEFSKPAALVGVDVSLPSLQEAQRRAAMHGANVHLIYIEENAPRLPLGDCSIDYIHSSGVLHHVPDPSRVLRELRRVLHPGGSGRIMVYNYDSVWLHLFAAYMARFRHPGGRSLSVHQAFQRSTDTADCPISHAWTVAEVISMCERAGFSVEHVGNAVSVREMAVLPERFEAILEPELEEEHRRFLLDLTFDARGVPYYRERTAGIDACYLLNPA